MQPFRASSPQFDTVLWYRIGRGRKAAVYCSETGRQHGTDAAVAESNTSLNRLPGVLLACPDRHRQHESLDGLGELKVFAYIQVQ